MTLTLGILANRDEYYTFGESKFSFQVSPGVVESRKFNFNFDKEIQPRIGFTFIIDKKAGDKLYANFGRYMAMDNKSIARAAAPKRLYQNDGWFLTDGTLLLDAPRAAETGKIILSEIKPTYQDEFVIGYSRPLFGRKWVIDVWGQYRTLKNIVEDYPTVNRTTTPSSYVYGNLDGSDRAFGALAKRKYQALTIQVQRPFAGKWSLMAMYTLSKLWGNWDLDYATSLFYASSAWEDGPGLYVMDPNRYGLMIGDRTHIFKLFGSWEFFKRTALSGYIRVQSGRPWEKRGIDYYGGYRAFLEKAGSHRLETWTNFDLQLTHSIPFGRFIGVIEARVMSVFNQQATLTIDQRGDQPTYQQASSYASPRRFVLAFHLNF